MPGFARTDRDDRKALDTFVKQVEEFLDDLVMSRNQHFVPQPHAAMRQAWAATIRLAIDED